MKILGAELGKWMNEGWPGDDWYWETDLFDDYPDADKIYDTREIHGLLYQGKDPDVEDMPSLDTLIKRWRKARDFSTLSFDCPKSAEQEVKDYLASKGCKII